MDNSSFSPQRFIGIMVAVIVVLSIPLTLVLLSQQQDIRQRAQSNGSVLAAKVNQIGTPLVQNTQFTIYVGQKDSLTGSYEAITYQGETTPTNPGGDQFPFLPCPGCTGPFPFTNTDGHVIAYIPTTNGKDTQKKDETFTQLPPQLIVNDVSSISAKTTLPGIGRSVGDNTKPKNATRSATIFIFDANNQLAGTGSGLLTFNVSSYSGTFAIPALVASPSASYTVKLAMDNTLQKPIPGTFKFLPNTTIELPTTPLISGDINQNNELDLADFNTIRDCMNGIAACTVTYARLSDLNDDGEVEEIDMNILLRGFANKNKI